MTTIGENPFSHRPEAPQQEGEDLVVGAPMATATGAAQLLSKGSYEEPLGRDLIDQPEAYHTICDTVRHAVCKQGEGNHRL